MSYDIKFTRYHLTVQAIDDKNTPLGYLSILFDGDDAKLMGLIRHPDYKGQGVCEKMTKTCLAICDGLGIQHVYIAVLKDKLGYIKMLESIGFKDIECPSEHHRRFVREYELRNKIRST